jgi:putative DNA primase/helicase
MELLGARLVIGSETEDGRHLDEATMKRLTGGDPLTARRLYREPVTWTPTHQIVYVTNHLPTVKGNDPAVWRRVRVVPFGVVVAPEDRDPRLPETLLLHVDAVLAWAVEGYRDWQANGMAEPASVLTATNAYQSESDAVARFIAERCEASPYVHATTRELHSEWSRWAVSDGADPMSERAFSAELARLGYEARKTNRGKVWAGLRPQPDDENVGGGDAW